MTTKLDNLLIKYMKGINDIEGTNYLHLCHFNEEELEQMKKFEIRVDQLQSLERFEPKYYAKHYTKN